jgi:nitrite reductase/ring-hydroxylating ferredoxin subunit
MRSSQAARSSSLAAAMRPAREHARKLLRCAVDGLTVHGYAPPRNKSATGHAGTYRRSLPVELARLYENALDWEHLPRVHPGSFRAIEILEHSANRWRARTESAEGRESVIELALDRDSRRWVTTVLSGEGAGNEIWTHAFPMEPRRVDIVVDFFLPGVPAERRDAVGAAYARLYARLYDEDVAMMVERARQLDQRIGESALEPREVILGPRATLELPQRVSLGGREFVVVASDGALRAFPAVCPHQLGPLGAGRVEAGVVTCPWHGDRFELATGVNLSGRLCRLHPLPQVGVSAAGTVTVALVSGAETA